MYVSFLPLVCAYLGISIEVESDDGLIRTTEGTLPFVPIVFNGFNYGILFVRVTTLTYSEYAARGFNIEDEFDPEDIPAVAADGK